MDFSSKTGPTGCMDGVSSSIVCVLANYFRIIDFENFVIYGYAKEHIEVDSCRRFRFSAVGIIASLLTYMPG